MRATRLAPDLVTPPYEDAGLFPSDLCRHTVALLPGPRRTARQDIVFDGLIDRTYRVPVFFAGRRAALAAPLEDMARQAAAPQAGRRGADRSGAQARGVPVRIDGAWRRLVEEDRMGFALVTHQFVAAAWIIGTGTGALMLFGMPPVR